MKDDAFEDHQKNNLEDFIRPKSKKMTIYHEKERQYIERFDIDDENPPNPFDKNIQDMKDHRNEDFNALNYIAEDSSQ